MRILALTNLYPNPYQPNRAPFNRHQFRALAERHEVAVIAPIAWTDELAARARGGGGLPRERRVTLDGVVVDHPRYLYPPKVLRGWYGHFFRRSVRRSFERALAEFRPDVVLGSWAYPDGWAAVELGRQAGLPVVVKVHGCDVLCGGRGLRRHPERRRQTVEALRRADAVVAVSNDLAEQVISLGVDAARVHVVHNGVDGDLFHRGPAAEARLRLGLDPDEPILLFVGNLEAVKGVDVLLEACAALARDRLPFRCCLIGQGPLRRELERQIAGRGLEGRVRLLGPRPQGELPDWYRSATVFVLPSRSEGVPNVLLEAAACGAPFVASRVGGIPEIAHLGVSRLVPREEPELLAQALAAFVTGNVRRGPEPAAPIRSHAEAAAELAGVFAQVYGAQGRSGAAAGVEGMNRPARKGVVSA